MSEPVNLKELAEKATKEEITATTNEAVAETVSAEEEDDTIVIGTPKAATQPTAESMHTAEPVKFDLNDKDLNSPIPAVDDMSVALLESLNPEEKIKMEEYRKNLIVNGFTPIEAGEAVINKIKKDRGISTLIEKDPNEEIPTIEDDAELAVIEIDKKTSTSEALGLTDDEHAKLAKVKAIKLVEVQDEELKTIKLDKYDTKHKADYVKSIEGSLSKYSVPLPMYGDFVTFRGAQIVQLISAVTYEDDKMEDVIDKKASLIYDKMISGKLLNKFDENGKIKMSYTQFANIFPYQDVDLALYAVLVASSMEEADTTLTCDKCKTEFDYHYNIKTLINLEDMTDEFKERTDTIIGKKSDPNTLGKLHEDMYKVRRYKSPITNNIYDISYPTVARASTIFRKIDQSDATMMYISALALYLNKIYVYNASTGGYIDIGEEEVDIILDTLLSVPDEDFTMIMEQIKNHLVYLPKFTIKAECPHCHNKISVDLNVDNLVFWKAQDSFMEIR